jgi:hypothetical protein
VCRNRFDELGLPVSAGLSEQVLKMRRDGRLSRPIPEVSGTM